MQGYVDTLRQQPQAIARLIALARANANADPERVRRRADRVPLPSEPYTYVEIPSGTGEPSREFVMRPFDLSTGGLGALHGGFLHANTPVFVVLRLCDGEACRLPGRIVRCDHLEQRVHAIGIAFERAIDGELMPDRPATAGQAPEAPATGDASASLVADALTELATLASKFAELAPTVRSLGEIEPLAKEFWKTWRERTSEVGLEPQPEPQPEPKPKPQPEPEPKPKPSSDPESGPSEAAA